MDKISGRQGTKHIHVRLEEMLKAWRVLRDLSLASGQFFLDMEDAPQVFSEDVYFVNKFETLHNLYIGIQKLLENSFVSNVGSAT